MYKSKIILVSLFVFFGLYLMAQTTDNRLTMSIDTQIAAMNVGQGASKHPISHFHLTRSSGGTYIIYLNSVIFSTTGSYNATDILKFQLWQSEYDDFNQATRLGSDITSSLGTGSHSFTGISLYFPARAVRYFWITMDLSPTATRSSYLNVAEMDTSSFTISTGSKSGSASAAGRQTIVFATQPNDFFRSKQSGNWDDLSTWQSSHDGTNWYNATLIPDESSRMVTIRQQDTITLQQSISVNSISNDGVLVSGNKQISASVVDNHGTIKAARKTILLSGSLVNHTNSTIDYTAPITIPASNGFYYNLTLSAPGVYYQGGVLTGINILHLPSEDTHLNTMGNTLGYDSITGDGEIVTGGNYVSINTSDPALSANYISSHSLKNPIYRFIASSNEDDILYSINFKVNTSNFGAGYLSKFELYQNVDDDFEGAWLVGETADNWVNDDTAITFSDLREGYGINLDAGAHNYFWITVDAGNFPKPPNPNYITLSVNALTDEDLEVDSGEIIPSTYAGAAQSFLPSTFTLNSSNPAVPASNVTQGSLKNPVYKFTISTPCQNCVVYLNQLDFNVTGNARTNEIDKLQLWVNTSDDLSTATFLAEQTYSGTGNKSFGSLNYHIVNSDVLNYFWITADVKIGASTNRNITISAITNDHITLSGGNKNESYSTYAGGRQTIATAVYHYRSNNTGNWGTAGTWQSSTNGVDWANSRTTPKSTDATITIRAGHTVTVDANVSVDQVLVEAGGTVVVNSSSTLTIANGAEAVDMHVKGVLKSLGTITVSNNAQLLICCGGVYEHAHTNPSSGLPPIATWEDGSLLKITGFSTSANIPQDAAWNQSFYDVEYNCASQGNYNTNLNFQNFLQIRNDFIVASTGRGTGTISFAVDGTGETKDIGGSLIVTGGTVDLAQSGYNTLQLGGDLIIQEPGKVKTGTSSGECKITFVDGGVHNVDVYDGGLSGKITVEVKDNSTLNLGFSVLKGTGGFLLEAGSTLETAHPSGLNGNITMNGTKTLSTGGNYVFDGSDAQVTGSLLPVTVNNITINNNSGDNPGVTLTKNLTVNGTMTMTEGNLSLGSNSLSYGNNANLVYNGAHPQSSGPEWLNNMSRPVTISNSSDYGLTLTGDKTNNNTVVVTNGAVFDMQDNSIGGSGSFTLRDDATLISSHPQGVDSIGTSGGISLSQNATYVFNGSTSQETGNNIPPVVNNLVIDNPEGVIWSHDIYVTEELDVIAGSFDVDFHYFTFPTDGVVVKEFSVATSKPILMNHRINRSWNIQGTWTGGFVRCRFYWDTADDEYFDWAGQAKVPSVYKGSSEITQVDYFISTDEGVRSWVEVQLPSEEGLSKGIYTIGASGNDTLPVELSSFTASMNAYNHVTLQWVTQSETNVSGFRIYRHTEMDLSTATMLNMWVEATNTSQMQIYQVNDDEIYEEDTYYYWLENVDMDGSSAFHGPLSIQVNFSGIVTPGIPIVQGINNSYPNPFNPTVTIRYGITNPGLAKLSVYNIKGQLVKELFSGQREVGNYSISWDGKDNYMRSTTSGTYFLRLDVSGKKYVKKIIQKK